MKTVNVKTAKTLTSGKSKPTQRTTAEVHAEARERGLVVHPTGEVLHQTVEVFHQNASDAEPINYSWGCALGNGLAIDAAHAIRLNDELGFSPEEGIQNLLSDAFRNLNRSTTVNDVSRRGLAVGVIYTIAALAAYAIQRPDALAMAEGLRDEAVGFAVSDDIEQTQRLKARAMASPR